ncbi:hypothetical protein BH23GEM6_BH23GEM6_16110 [soil metagenome]
MMYDSPERAAGRNSGDSDSVAEDGPEFRRKIDCSPRGDTLSARPPTAPRGRGIARRECGRESYHGRD